MIAKVRSPEQDDDYVYFAQENKSFLDQVIHEQNGNYLLNVRKIYTDNVYYGVAFTTFNPEFGIKHQFKCKDRPLGHLNIVEDKYKFISMLSEYPVNFLTDTENDNLIQKEIFFNLLYRVFFCFTEDGKYRNTLFLLEDGRNFRGIYGADTDKQLKKHRRLFNGFGSIGPPSKEQVIAFYEDKMTSYSNTQISISTDYSNIIIEHKTQYNQEWSDIKRRRDVKKSTNDE